MCMWARDRRSHKIKCCLLSDMIANVRSKSLAAMHATREAPVKNIPTRTASIYLEFRAGVVESLELRTGSLTGRWQGFARRTHSL